MSDNWIAGSRTAQLTMAKNWLVVMSAQRIPWDIPGAVFTQLDSLIQAADSALSKARREKARTSEATGECKAAFDALIDNMRDTKRCYFLSPPLQTVDYIELGLKPPNTGAMPAASGFAAA